ncbi:MAG: hypothetical protein RJQ09_16180 [Cyclobacteriaceae bacterium]
MSFKSEILAFIKSVYAGEIKDLGFKIELPALNRQLILQPIPRNLRDEKARENFNKSANSIRIWEDQWITKGTVVQSRLRSLFNETISIYGRETTVVKLTQPQLDEFLETNHLMGTTKAKTKMGLINNKRLVAAASFGKPQTINRDGKKFQSHELIRYCNKNGCSVIGGLSKLLNHYISDRTPDDIMTYVDLEWSSGESFKSLGFENEGRTPAQEFWIKPSEMVRHYPHRLVKADLPNDPEKLHSLGYFKICNAGNVKLLMKLK